MDVLNRAGDGFDFLDLGDLRVGSWGCADRDDDRCEQRVAAKFLEFFGAEVGWERVFLVEGLECGC